MNLADIFCLGAEYFSSNVVSSLFGVKVVPDETSLRLVYVAGLAFNNKFRRKKRHKIKPVGLIK